MKTAYEIRKIITQDRFLVRNSDYREGVIDKDGKIIIAVAWNDIYYYDDTFKCVAYYKSRVTYDINGNIIKREPYD